MTEPVGETAPPIVPSITKRRNSDSLLPSKAESTKEGFRELEEQHKQAMKSLEKRYRSALHQLKLKHRACKVLKARGLSSQKASE
eukprot:jgi/Galph1/5000/GphlegSOOS_G3636.1